MWEITPTDEKALDKYERYPHLYRKENLKVEFDGEINMFDTNGVQKIANNKGFYELVVYIEEHRDEYCRFILTEMRLR